MVPSQHALPPGASTSSLSPSPLASSYQPLSRPFEGSHTATTIWPETQAQTPPKAVAQSLHAMTSTSTPAPSGHSHPHTHDPGDSRSRARTPSMPPCPGTLCALPALCLEKYRLASMTQLMHHLACKFCSPGVCSLPLVLLHGDLLLLVTSHTGSQSSSGQRCEDT